jgi:hypothetical protein
VKLISLANWTYSLEGSGYPDDGGEKVSESRYTKVATTSNDYEEPEMNTQKDLVDLLGFQPRLGGVMRRHASL